MTNNTDQIMLYTDKPSQYPPEFSKEPLTLFFNAPHGTGLDYCQTQLGIYPETVNARCTNSYVSPYNRPNYTRVRSPKVLRDGGYFPENFDVRGDDLYLTNGDHEELVPKHEWGYAYKCED